MPNFLGWLVGVMVGVVLVIAIFAALALPIPPVVGFLAAIVTAIAAVVGTVTPTVALIMALALLVFFYLWAYAFATASVGAGLPAVTLPLPAPFPVPAGAPVAVPAFAGELFARGVMIGQTAVLNAAVLSFIPVIGSFLATWAFVIVSLAAVILIARNRVFHGFLGWSAWLFPMSYVATAIGLLLFLVNAPVVLVTIGIGAFRIDWTTGVVETTGGLSGITGFSGGFSLGNFNFITGPLATGNFTAPSIPSHETGHTLSTAALSGVVLWINAFDENWPIFRWNLAYGELTAESHAQAQPGAPRAAFFVRLWG